VSEIQFLSHGLAVYRGFAAQVCTNELKLGLDDLIVKNLDVDQFVPAPAQGMLGIQCRDEEQWIEGISRLNCPEAADAVAVERMLLNRLDGGCQLPFGVNIQQGKNGWQLETFFADSPEDNDPLRISLQGSNPAELAEEAWVSLADRMKKQGKPGA